MAKETVPPFAVLALLREETPVDRHSSRVAEDSLAHAPKQEEEQEVEDG